MYSPHCKAEHVVGIIVVFVMYVIISHNKMQHTQEPIIEIKVSTRKVNVQMVVQMSIFKYGYRSVKLVNCTRKEE